MIVGIAGLGLIGGSFAKAYKEAGHTVYAFDTDRSILSFAEIGGFVEQELTKDNIKDCDLVLVCIYPKAAIGFMEEMGPYIGEKPVVIDCCGTKREVFTAGAAISDKYGFTYVGGHPMAGTQYSGFKYARANLYHNAPMVLVLKDHDDVMLISRIQKLLEPCGFKKFSNTTAEDHDRIIAFTSQLAHVVSNAYVKSPSARIHKGFSAGSYKDMTRVAWLNPQMWAELFLDNKDFLIDELDTIISNLTEYKEAMEAGDRDRLTQLLADGRDRKEEIDGR